MLGLKGIIFGMSTFDALQSVHAPQLGNVWDDVFSDT
jgi:hypothetical protein